MRVTERIAALADALASARAPLTTRERALYEALRRMPEHFARGALDAWEGDYQGALGDSPSQSLTEDLFDEVFDFGRCNMYGAFDVARTALEYDALRRILENAGVEVGLREAPARW